MTRGEDELVKPTVVNSKKKHGNKKIENTLALTQPQWLHPANGPLKNRCDSWTDLFSLYMRRT